MNYYFFGVFPLNSFNEEKRPLRIAQDHPIKQFREEKKLFFLKQKNGDDGDNGQVGKKDGERNVQQKSIRYKKRAAHAIYNPQGADILHQKENQPHP